MPTPLLGIIMQRVEPHVATEFILAVLDLPTCEDDGSEHRQ